MKQVLLLNSGGPDCACIAKRLKDDGLDIVSVYVDTLQSNRFEAMRAAEITAQHWCLVHNVVPIDFGMSTTTKPDNTWLAAPFLIPLLISIGATYASLRKIPEVYFGFRKVMRDGWWDEAKRWVVTPHGHFFPEANFPIHDMSRGETLAWAGLTMADLSWTVSCNVSPACGECRKCQERKESE